MSARAMVAAAMLGLAVWGGVATTAAALLTPLVAGWEQFFKVEWSADERKGKPVVSGRVKNDWGIPARNIRLLVDALDSSGQVVSQRVGWLGSDLPPGISAYFEVPMPERAPAYRVSVFAFDWVQVGGPRDR